MLQPLSLIVLPFPYGSADGALGNDVPELRRGNREKFPSMKLQDFVTYTVIKKSPSPTSPALEPSSECRDAMQKEICALEDNDT
ncbi:hypothetical protein EPI10_011241 [Gossypium australe]|uniref:Uncharacterized protein n=1 Tax=Gossypium australe TaxID=47621 RepID=A0A5B6W8A1_9ROSI|nr:hypothetical protein EPI10_011241 [Gossypium australe]